METIPVSKFTVLGKQMFARIKAVQSIKQKVKIPVSKSGKIVGKVGDDHTLPKALAWMLDSYSNILPSVYINWFVLPAFFC